MKLLAFILITASLVLGTLSAATAYIPQLANVDADMNLTLNAPAGLADEQPDDADAPRIPFVNPSDDVHDGAEVKLSAELIEQLRERGVERVRVKEFAFGRWDGRWVFLLSCVGLVIGAGLVRHQAARTVAAAIAAERPPAETPEYALRVVHDEVRALREKLASVTSTYDRTDLIVETLDRLQHEHLDVVADATAELTARLGPAGYARLMDRFAAAERQLNRAWSAAADGVLEEAMDSLERGEALLEEATARMAE